MKLKKLVWSLLLACCFLFPACDLEGTGNATSTSNGDSHVESTGGSVNSDSNDSDSSDSAEDGDYDGEHVDSNDDGFCDDCNESVTINLDFYAVNDLHGKFDDTAAQIGVDELSTYLKEAKEDNPYTFVLSSGDMWQGSPESNITKGALITDWMNEMNFVSMSLGNHEFDWGIEYIQNNAQIAEFPFLGINVYDTTTNQRATYCQPSVVVEEGEVKIGVIGAIGDCLSSISGDFNKNLDFKKGSELTNLVKAESRRLRREEGVDFVVYSIHADYAEYDVALSDGYVDLVFEGHSHKAYAKKDAKGVYHVQSGGDNQTGVSHAEIKLNYVTNSYVSTAKNLSTNSYKDLDDHPVVDTLMTKYADVISFASQRLGENAKTRESTEILNLCAKLYYEEGVKEWGTKYNLFLGGGFMNTRAPYSLRAGTLYYGDLMNVLPFDNQLVLCSIKGRDLKDKFLSGRDRYYVYCGEYGQENLSNIVDTQTYYLVTDTYSSTYTSNRLTEIERYSKKNTIGEYIFARDLLAEYIKTGAWGMENLKISTVAEILSVGGKLAANETTTEVYAVRGKIVSIDNTTYGNMTIEDATGSVYVYGVNDMDGNRYGSMANQPQVGDTVLLIGKIKNFVNDYYGSKVELIETTLKETA